MGKRSDEIDAKIRHYRWLASIASDQRAADAIASIISELIAEKCALDRSLH